MTKEAIDSIVTSPTGRRRFLKQVSATGIGVAAASMLGRGSLALAQDAMQITDADILNFALNLEYLEAEFYSVATYGATLLKLGILTESEESGPTTGGNLVPDFGSSKFAFLATALRENEIDHVQYLRAALGSAARRALSSVAWAYWAGVKSIAAYRTGLGLLGERPSEAEVTAAAGRWLASVASQAGAGQPDPPRLADETLQRFLVWCGVDLRLPVQFHVGYGDSDVDLHRCNPLLLTPLLRAIQPTGVPVMLLHNYPYHREAGYLAQVFPQVYVDAGLATHNLGARGPALLAEALELAPYGKFLYSSDAFGLPELYYLSAALFRQALSAFLRTGLDDDLYSERTVVRLTWMLCAGNARRAYRLNP